MAVATRDVRAGAAEVNLDEPNIAAELRRCLASFRSRGWSFERAWRPAIEILELDERLDKQSASIWKTVLRATRATWQAGYERRSAAEFAAIRQLEGSAE